MDGAPKLLELKHVDNASCAIMYFSGDKLYLCGIEA